MAYAAGTITEANCDTAASAFLGTTTTCSACSSHRPARPRRQTGIWPRTAHATRACFSTPPISIWTEAAAGTLSLAPSAPMLDALERDYNAMAGMIMGPVPPFADVMDAVSALEERLNAGA